MWITQGDMNAKFFHNYVNQRRLINSIWEMQDSIGNQIHDQRNLQREGQSFFDNIFRSPKVNNIVNQLRMVSLYPIFFSEEEGNLIASLVTIKEVKKVLASFAKEKSSGLDGWKV